LLRAAARISALSTALSSALCIAGIALANGTGSLALLAFGLESLVDAGASAVLVWRFRAEGREPERGAHVERRARWVIAFVLVSVAIYLLGASIWSLTVGREAHESIGSVVLASIGVVLLPGVAYRKLALARGLGSRSLRADGLLTAAGAGLAAITLSALLLARYAGIGLADPLAALVVALVLLREAAGAFRDA
jgi:divalent metal cation (Fe/Co/Zn/Cd) transporter